MKKNLKGRYCLIKRGWNNARAKIIRAFVWEGGLDHGEEFVSVILDDSSLNIWSKEVTCKLRDVKLLD